MHELQILVADVVGTDFKLNPAVIKSILISSFCIDPVQQQQHFMSLLCYCLSSVMSVSLWYYKITRVSFQDACINEMQDDLGWIFPIMYHLDWRCSKWNERKIRRGDWSLINNNYYIFGLLNHIQQYTIH
jgi:hypothetical protein